MMFPRVVLFTLLLALIAACTAPAPSPTPTSIPTELPTATPLPPTPTVTPTITPTPRPSAKNLTFAINPEMKEAQADEPAFAAGVPSVFAAVEINGMPPGALIVWRLWRGDSELLNTFEPLGVSQGTVTRTLLSSAREAVPGEYRLAVKAGKEQVEGRFTIGAQGADATRPLVEENFDDNALKWDLDNSQGGSAHIADGQLSLKIDQADTAAGATLGTKLADFDLTVAVSQTNGWHDGYYTVFLRDTGQAAYAFSMATDGWFVVGYAPYRGNWVDVVPYQRTNALKRDAPNRLRVIAQGDKFAFYINDTLLATMKDDRLTSGAIGLYAGTYKKPGLAALYDDLTIKPPQEGIVLTPTKVPPTAAPQATSGPAPTAKPKTLPLVDVIIRTRNAVESLGGAMDRLYGGSAEACAPFMADYNTVIGAPTYDVAAQPANVQGAYASYRQAVAKIQDKVDAIAGICRKGGGVPGRLSFDLARMAVNEAGSLLTNALAALGQ